MLAAVNEPRAALCIEGCERQRRLFVNGALLLTLNASFLSDEGVKGGKRFTGSCVGLAAVGIGTADFIAYSEEMQI